MLDFVLPKIEREASARNYGKFVIGPMESGYGITLPGQQRVFAFKGNFVEGDKITITYDAKIKDNVMQ